MNEQKLAQNAISRVQVRKARAAMPDFPAYCEARKLVWKIEQLTNIVGEFYCFMPTWLAAEFIRFEQGVAYAREIGEWDRHPWSPAILNYFANTANKVLIWWFKTQLDKPLELKPLPEVENIWHTFDWESGALAAPFTFRHPEGTQGLYAIDNWHRARAGKPIIPYPTDDPRAEGVPEAGTP